MSADAALRAWLGLSFIRGLGSEGVCRLLAELGDPEAIFAASPQLLRSLVQPTVASAIAQGYPEELVESALAWLEAEHNHVVTLADEAYPQALLNIGAPPFLLYVKGNLGLLNQPCISIVGSRHATPQGLNNAEAFAATLSQSGLTIVSGLAHGIDAAAHRGGLKFQGSSIAVVGTGLDKVYPAANRELAHCLAAQGALISEFPLGTPPVATNFPRRNRIISGMGKGCLVVEASIQSGSLITARLATEQGRDVFAVPGSIHAPQSKGCHLLIKQGAKLVETAQDVLEELGMSFAPALPPKAGADDSQLLTAIGEEPVDIDTLSNRCGLTVSELSAMLLTLELNGAIAVLPGGLYQRLH